MSDIEDKPPPFAIIPLEVMMDKRLTLETMRILITLFSFRNKNTGLAFPKREALAKRCGMHPSNISAATRKLVELGWLVKEGAGGYGLPTKYTITVPEIVADSATVVQSATVAESASSTVVQSATSTVAESATRNKATNNITNKGTENTIAPPKSPKKSDSENLLSHIDPQIASDFLLIRKAKHLPLTQTALAAIERESEKMSYSLEQALTVCCERGWGSFKAAWLLQDQSKDTKEQENREATLQAKARLFGSNHTEKDISHETTRL